MSSESDEDFQSADEGSDLEEIERLKIQPSGSGIFGRSQTASSSEDEGGQDEEVEVDRKGSREINAGKNLSPDTKETLLDFKGTPSDTHESNTKDLEDDDNGDEEDIKQSYLMGALKNLSLQVNQQLTTPKDESYPGSEDSEEEEEEPLECKFKTLPREVASELIGPGKPQIVIEQDNSTESNKKENVIVENRVENSSLITMSGESSTRNFKWFDKDEKLMLKEESVEQEISEKLVHQSERVLCSQSNSSEIKSAIQERNISEIESPIQKSINSEIKSTVQESNISEIKSTVQKSNSSEIKSAIQQSNSSPEIKSIFQESKLGILPDQDKALVKVMELENKAQNVQQTIQKPKPIRESKIGMKKPREKLGERLGARKLGAKIDKKPMEGIGSETSGRGKSDDQLVDEKKVHLQTATDSKMKPYPQATTTACNSREIKDLTKPGDKKGLLDTSKEEEERWQQIHNVGGLGGRDSDDGWGAPWGNWGTTLISAASTFTQEVGRGVGSIMDTVEGTLGVPDPETLAREMAEREREVKEALKRQEQEHCSVRNEEVKRRKSSSMESEDITNKSDLQDSTEDNLLTGRNSGFSSLGSLVSGVSGVFETASNKVLMGGLDTLEVIGRKAMDAIQEGDPGLREKRAFLAGAKPNLATVLQEARQRAVIEEKEQHEGTSASGEKSLQPVRPTLDQAWETTEGCVHIEALSLVARQCDSKMSSMFKSMPHYLVEKIQAANATIKDACELEEESVLDSDFISRVEEIVPLIGVPIQSQKINNAWISLEETVSSIKEAGTIDGPTAERELYAALAFLVAQLSAVFHKGGELALITPDVDPIDVAVQFRELSTATSGGIENTADTVCSIITNETSAANPQVNNTITNIYMQAASCNNYIQQCMTHLSSLLQYSNTKLMTSEL